jgi:hypothetical protein
MCPSVKIVIPLMQPAERQQEEWVLTHSVQEAVGKSNVWDVQVGFVREAKLRERQWRQN